VEPGISMQGNNDFVRIVLVVAQIIMAWHDSNSNKRQYTRYRIKGIIIARVSITDLCLLKPNKD